MIIFTHVKPANEKLEEVDSDLANRSKKADVGTVFVGPIFFSP